MSELKLKAPPSPRGAQTHLRFLLKGHTFSKGLFAAGQEVSVKAIRHRIKSLSPSACVLSGGTSLLGSRSLLKANTAGEGLSNCPHLLLVLLHKWPRIQELSQPHKQVTHLKTELLFSCSWFPSLKPHTHTPQQFLHAIRSHLNVSTQQQWSDFVENTNMYFYHLRNCSSFGRGTL